MNRRTVLWAAPAVALAASAPAYATSNATPELVCTPKGNRSQRHDGHGRRWDYHVDPGCVAVLAVWIGSQPATYERQGKRWTVRDMPAKSDRVQAVHVVAKGGTWSGGVRFS